MPKSYTNLLYHLVFSTRERIPIITVERRPRLYDYVGGMIREFGGVSLAIGGIEDHLHLLAKLRPDKALSDVLRDLKANSTGWSEGLLLAERLWRVRRQHFTCACHFFIHRKPGTAP